MNPVIAIIGRPNVGKSTLFNRITKSRDALVADLPGLTRDRQYGEGEIDGHRFIAIDTGGLGEGSEGLDRLTLEQTRQALTEADAVIFVVDGRVGRCAADEVIASQLRIAGKNIFLTVNKTEGINPNIAMVEFQALGLGRPYAIAAEHGEGVSRLMTAILEKIKKTQPEEKEVASFERKGIKVALIGRPNVGKSTLINRILGEERVVVYDQAGTTRDSVFIPFCKDEQDYTLIDTAGVRRRSRVTQKVEKFSVIKALQAIQSSDVVVCMLDARDNVVEHDLRLLGYVLDAGKALVIAVNKWDHLSADHKGRVKKEIQRRLLFAQFARMHFISALHGTGVGDLFASIQEAYESACKHFNTGFINQLLAKAVQKHQPSRIKGRPVKLRYAHLGGHQPPTLVIHGNQVKSLPINYRRYLANFFQKSLNLVGTPLRLQFKSSENPFQGKPNQGKTKKDYRKSVKSKASAKKQGKKQ
jgi:GTP-binding protein